MECLCRTGALTSRILNQGEPGAKIRQRIRGSCVLIAIGGKGSGDLVGGNYNFPSIQLFVFLEVKMKLKLFAVDFAEDSISFKVPHDIMERATWKGGFADISLSEISDISPDTEEPYNLKEGVPCPTCGFGPPGTFVPCR